MHRTTRFTEPDAVEAWDAQFRWRDGDRLHDTTVEQTWQRVAGAIADPEGAAAEQWTERFAEQFRQWRLLPDERLLRLAGTHSPPSPLPEPAVVLNVAAFVIPSTFGPARFQRAAFVDAAALAVRLLDDALLVDPEGGGQPGLRIGPIGVSDAIVALGAAPKSAAAAAHATDFGQALCEGCLTGAVELAIERGARMRADTDFLRRWRARGMPGALLERAELHGLRFDAMTSLQAHPTLARLANCVQDGIDWKSPSANKGAREHLRIAMQAYFDHPAASQD